MDNAATRARARARLDMYEAVNAVNMKEPDQKKLFARWHAELGAGLPEETPDKPLTKAQRLAEIDRQERGLRLALGKPKRKR